MIAGLAKEVLKRVGNFRVKCSYCGSEDLAPVTENGIRLEWPWQSLKSFAFACSDLCARKANNARRKRE